MTRLAVAALFALAAVAVLAPAAPVPKGVKQPGLDGTWELLRQNAGGEERVVSTTFHWTIEGEALTTERNGGREPGHSGPDCSLVRPKDGPANARDYVIHSQGDNSSDLSFRGIAEVDGDTFTFCYTLGEKGERPKECKAGPGVVLFVFKRVHPAK